MSQEISDAGLVKSTRQRFGTRGTTQLLLEESIVPVWDVSDPSLPYHSKGGGSMNLSQAAVAASISYVGVIAPANLPANFRAVIRAFQFLVVGVFQLAGIVDALSANFTTLALTQAPIQFSWDGLDRPALQSLLGANALSIGVNAWAFSGLSQPILLPFVLSPGQAFLVQTSGLNQQAGACVYWDEYYIS